MIVALFPDAAGIYRALGPCLGTFPGTHNMSHQEASDKPQMSKGGLSDGANLVKGLGLYLSEMPAARSSHGNTLDSRLIQYDGRCQLITCWGRRLKTVPGQLSKLGSMSHQGCCQGCCPEAVPTVLMTI